MEGDATYFAKRATQERAAAEKARGTARDAHLELAHRYDDLHQAIAMTESVVVPIRQ